MVETGSDELLVAFIRRTLNLREERADITADIGDVLKEAKLAGFDSRKIGEVCRWIEKCEKHGRDAMMDAETIYHLYRDTFEGAAGAALFASATADASLAAKFAAPAPEKPRKITSKVAQLRADAAEARRALGEG